MPHFARVFVCLLAVLAALGSVFVPRTATAEDGDAGASSDASADGATDEPADPATLVLRATAAEVRALVGDRLAPEADPASLFDLSLGDDLAIAIEAARLRSLLRDVEQARHALDAGRRRATVEAGVALAGTFPVTPARWEARIDLDRARLEFYALPDARRHELVSRQAERKRMATADAEVDHRGREAEEQRLEALRAAQEARSEPARLVSEEYARLLDVEAKQSAFAKKLAAQRETTAARRETTLGWQRRTKQARAPDVPSDTVDAIYDELRRALRAARDDLDRALEEVSGNASEVPVAGADPLAELRTSVDMAKVREERTRVETAAAELAGEESAVHDERAVQLLDVIDTLNSERLALLPFLSSGKRTSITGFTTEGADQAASELRQLSLIVRSHRYATLKWLRSLRNGRAIGMTAGRVVLVLLEWLAALGLYLWFRRRTPLALAHLRKRSEQSDREDRLPTPSRATRAYGLALQVHRPIEWLAFAVLLSWLLPQEAQRVLEIQLVTVIVEWVLGGALVVVVVNALAGVEQGVFSPEHGSPALRLRSLRLVGRVVVAYGLVLVITSRLVGPGTIHHWVLSTCGFASLPVLLILVRWWRNVVFDRAERIRKKTAFEQWVLANRRGWKSFLAASSGGVYLFARGIFRAARSWVSRYKLTRIVLAYLFRRELGKLEAERTELVTARLPDATFATLGPDVPRDPTVTTDSEDDVEELLARLKERRGGVVAIVGYLGMGKSTLLRRIQATYADTLLVPAPDGGAAALGSALGAQLGLEGTPTLDVAAAALVASPSSRAILLDDAQHYTRPVMDGLATFDALIDAAGRHSSNTTWVFAFDEVLWLFLQRARGSRPLFDSVVRLFPWREEQIVELLRARTAGAGLEPSFERLLEKLPPNADEIDRLEALERRAASYYRLLWDYAAGNPGVALHMWRRALGADESGGTHVRFFQAPDASDLERLPDQSVFVLRAVLQLSPATLTDIAQATMLSSPDILDALRYAVARMYVVEEGGRYRITWTWFRAISVFLRRRHLLAST